MNGLPLADISFWNVVAWIIFAGICVLAIWLFVYIISDLFTRDDLSGLAKGIWVVALFIIPFFGALIYLIFRPKPEPPRPPMSKAAVEEIAEAQRLLGSGAISEAEYQALKARVLG